VRHSSATETTQFALSYDPCGKLRRARFDETSTLTGARVTIVRPLSWMLAFSVCSHLDAGKNRTWPILDLHFLFYGN